MTRDGGVTDPRWYPLAPDPARTLALGEVSGLDGGEPVVEREAGSDTPCARMTRLSVVLRQVYAELLRAHTSTVVTLGQFRSDRERMVGALAEARNQHEALGQVRDAAALLAVAVRRLGGRPEETVSCKQILWRIESLAWEDTSHL